MNRIEQIAKKHAIFGIKDSKRFGSKEREEFKNYLNKRNIPNQEIDGILYFYFDNKVFTICRDHEIVMCQDTEYESIKLMVYSEDYDYDDYDKKTNPEFFWRFMIYKDKCIYIRDVINELGKYLSNKKYHSELV